MGGVKKAFKRVFRSVASVFSAPKPKPAPVAAAPVEPPGKSEKEKEAERRRSKVGQLLGGRGRGQINGPGGAREDGSISIKRLLGE